ncbi:MAG: OB-fold nucleic acid binding domain-containing protein, partial [Bacteroidota bacterium]
KLTFFLRECKRMGVAVLGPDVNESVSNFSVNKKGQIRFGLSALKGVGEGPVEAILEERKKGGSFQTIFEMVRRLDLRTVNKKAFESLVLGGAFDAFEELSRSHYYAPSDKFNTYLEHLMRYGTAYKVVLAQAQNSLFGASEDVMIPEPAIPEAPEWTLIEKLTREKEVTGIYISGHPLDDYRLEVENFTTCTLDKAEAMGVNGQKLKLAATVTSAQHRISKKGTGWGLFTIQDYDGSMEFPLFSEDYAKYKHLLNAGDAIYLEGNFQKRWNSEELQFKLSEVRQLASIAAERTDSITIRLHIDRLTADIVNDLEMLCRTHKGKHKLKIEFLDATNKIRLQTYSGDKRVNADNDFVAELDRIGVAYKLNA